ncbi:MAG: c-type cytochrome [Ghiorsea sp.]
MTKSPPIPGAAIVQRKCAGCHFLNKKRRKVGPSLAGIYMRKPTISALPFALWDEAALDAWLTDPRSIKPNTPMAVSVRDPKVRAQVIAYLKTI